MSRFLTKFIAAVGVWAGVTFSAKSLVPQANALVRAASVLASVDTIKFGIAASAFKHFFIERSMSFTAHEGSLSAININVTFFTGKNQGHGDDFLYPDAISHAYRSSLAGVSKSDYFGVERHFNSLEHDRPFGFTAKFYLSFYQKRTELNTADQQRVGGETRAGPLVNFSGSSEASLCRRCLSSRVQLLRSCQARPRAGAGISEVVSSQESFYRQVFIHHQPESCKATVLPHGEHELDGAGYHCAHSLISITSYWYSAGIAISLTKEKHLPGAGLSTIWHT